MGGFFISRLFAPFFEELYETRLLASGGILLNNAALQCLVDRLVRLGKRSILCFTICTDSLTNCLYGVVYRSPTA